MSWCHNCGAEYRAGFTVCADCDLPLHEDPPAAVPLPARAGARPVVDNQIRTAVLGRFNTFEAEVVLDILRGAGIFALAKHGLEESDHYLYSSIESDRGVILVDASRLQEARTLVDEQLPIHLRQIEESMRTLEGAPEDAHTGTTQAGTAPWGKEWEPPD